MTAVIRLITRTDVAAVASIHAASWRCAYRGILRDDFLDGDLDSNRMALWEKRLGSPSPKHFGYLALQEELPVGFAFAFGEHDKQWGTLIDNLHVLPGSKSRGFGKRLLANLCEHADVALSKACLHLWVYEKNMGARGFYDSLGGELVEHATITAPDGGKVAECRYVWPSAKRLLEALNR
jgi:ribosomal protein S18 acetylase RimI-like enzyme